MTETAPLNEWAILDQETLDTNTMADLSLQKELFDLYFDHAPSNFAMLQAALDDNNKQTDWKQGSHALKGAARTLGLLRLGEAAAAAEMSEPSQSHYDSVKNAFEEAQETVQALFYTASP